MTNNPYHKTHLKPMETKTQTTTKNTTKNVQKKQKFILKSNTRNINTIKEPVVVYLREPMQQNKKSKNLVDSVNKFFTNDKTQRTEEQTKTVKLVCDKLAELYRQQCNQELEKRIIAIALSYNKKTKEVTYGACIYRRESEENNESVAKDGIRETAKKRYFEYPVKFTITDPNADSFTFNDVIAAIRKEMFTRGVDSNPRRVKRLEQKRTPKNSQTSESTTVKSTPVQHQ